MSSAGYGKRDIAADLGVSETTVKSHRAKAMRKKEANLIRKRIVPTLSNRLKLKADRRKLRVPYTIGTRKKLTTKTVDALAPNGPKRFEVLSP